MAVPVGNCTNGFAKNKRHCSSCQAQRGRIVLSSAAGITIADAEGGGGTSFCSSENDAPTNGSPRKVRLLLLLAFHSGPLAIAHPQVKGGGYVTLDKLAYDESESITVPIALPRKRQQRLHQLELRPVHARHQSPGGDAVPIVPILMRDADGCNTDEVALCAGHWNFTFGNKWRDRMRGMWPIEVEDHDIGYSTGKGARDRAGRIRRRGKCATATATGPA